MQIVLLVAGIVCLFLPGQIATGIVLILLTLLNAAMGLNQEGKAEASVAALQKMMVVKAKVLRDGELAEVPMERAGPGRHRQHRGRRPGPGGRPHRPCRDPGDRRVRPHRRERSRAQAGRCGCGRRGARRSHRHGVHEHPGDPRRRHAHRDDDRHGHGSRPHLGDAPGDQGRGDAADPAARALTNQILVIAGVALLASIGSATPAACRSTPLPDRRRVCGVRHPDRPAGGRHGRPVGWHPDPGEGRRDREAPSVGGDARLNVRHQLRQDRDADPEPDDRRPDGDRRPALRDLRGRLFHGRADHARGRPGRRAARRVHAADGPVRRRRCRERRR